MGLRIDHTVFAALLVSTLAAWGCTPSNPNPPVVQSGGTKADSTTTDDSGSADAGTAADSGTAAVTGTKPDVPDFAAAKFSNPTNITNAWFPLKPGTRLVMDGTSVDEEGDEETRSIAFTVSDLTKEVAGVRAVVCWDRDIVDGELEEREIVFFAQDDDGNVWHLGEYPEELSDGEIEASPGWMHGMKDGLAGIHMPGKPKMGDPDFAQGWAPSVPWTDRAKVSEVGAKVKVPTGEYEDVLVFEEGSAEETDGKQLKYYANGVGCVKVGYQGNDPSKEQLELVKIETLNAEDMAAARKEILEMDKRAGERLAETFGKSKPIEPASGG